MEKWVVRKAFEEMLPSVAWTKEQFSDGVGYGWIDTLKLQLLLKFQMNN
jgi:asparagine synthase (glutamine-hydrolysing)